MDVMTPLARVSQILAVRRDLKRVERMLREFSEPERGDALDVTQARAEVAELLDAITVDGADTEVFAAIDGFVDSHAAEFLRTLRERHNARLTRLDLLELDVAPHLAQSKTLMGDELTRLELLDVVIANLMLQTANPEKPITYTRHREQPRERHR